MAIRRWMADEITLRCRFYGQNAVKECAEDLLQKSRKLVPFKTGKLYESGIVEEIGETRTGNIIYQVKYESNIPGENGVFYNAVAQHEDLTYHHEVGQAKYLEQPYKENYELYKKAIAEKISEALRGIK